MIELPHGTIDTKWLDRTLICSPEGPINGPGAEFFSKKICASIKESRPSDPWVRVEYFRDFYTLATPDAYRFLLDSLVCSKSHGCKLICVIGVNSCNTYLFERFSQVADLPFFSFNCLTTLANFLVEHNSVGSAASFMKFIERL